MSVLGPAGGTIACMNDPLLQSHALLVILITAAVWRITRLVVFDSFPPAAWLRRVLTGEDVEYVDPAGGEPREGRTPPARWVPGWVTELYGCPWCVSVWVSAGVVAAVVWTVPGGCPLPWLVWPAAAGVAGWLAAQEG